MNKGNFRIALDQLLIDLGNLQYHPEYGEIAIDLLKEWDRNRGDDWVHTTLNEFKEKQSV